MTSTKFGMDITDYEGVTKRRTKKGVQYTIDQTLTQKELEEKGYLVLDEIITKDIFKLDKKSTN